MRFKKLIQVAVLQVFHNYAKWLFAGADAQYSSDIYIFQGGQNSNIAMEIDSAIKTYT